MKTVANELKEILSTPQCHFMISYFQNVISNVKNEGLWLEFGVCTGTSINAISSLTENKVYGFDSFYGLPEDWGNHQKKGTYSLNGTLPSVNDNVELVVGLFEDTLEDFLKIYKEPVAYLHLDADLYSSTKYVLDMLGDRIVSGTVISFDEIYNYSEYAEHELKAWVEFCNEKKVTSDWILRTFNEQATCIVK